jgi:hypothetical protein
VDACDWRRLDERVEGLSNEIGTIAHQDAGCERLFHFPRNKLSANEYRTARSMAFSTWAEIAAAPLVA